MRETLTSPSSWRVCQFRHGRGGAAGEDYAAGGKSVKRVGREENGADCRLTIAESPSHKLGEEAY